MNSIETRAGGDSLQKPIDDLMQQFGRWRLFWALIRASFRPSRAITSESELSNHLRRDLNLPVHERTPQYWDYL